MDQCVNTTGAFMKSISYNLKDKSFVITGGSRGIGFTIAKMLLDEGASVLICGRKQDNLEKAAEALNGGDSLAVHTAHIAKEEDVDSLFDKAVSLFGTLDGFVHNAAMNIPTTLVDSDAGIWNKIMDTNLNGAYLCLRKAGRVMKNNGRGKIVSISSIASRRAAPFMGIYGIAKAGIEMMTRVVAQELAPYNIQVNAVAPAMVRTDFSRPFWSDENIHAHIVKTIPMGRIAEQSDVAHPVLFLLSEGADYITGTTIAVDGGSLAV